MAALTQQTTENLAHDELSAALCCLLAPGPARVEGCACAAEAHVSSEASYFVLKAETRSSIEDSLTQGVWATKARASCTNVSGSQPHERLASSRRLSQRVVLLFAVRFEHAWVGHATLESDPYFDSQEEWPYVFRISWRACLPHAQGVSFGELDAAGAHKVFNCDEISCGVGNSVRAAIDAKVVRLKQEADSAHRVLCESSFLTMLPTESEQEFHVRLLLQVEARLGPILLACLCGSRRYNLDVPGSDRDLLVVFSAEDPSAHPPLIKNPPLIQPDFTIVEVGRFIEMLLDGDPSMVETLFLQDNPALLRAASPWTSLEQLRRRFLSRRLVRKYLNDATGRAGLAAVRKGTKAARHRKILYIAYRTLANALQAARGQDLQLWRHAGSSEHDAIMAVRRGDSTVPKLLERAEVLAVEVHSALEANVDLLPEMPAQETAAQLKSWLEAWRLGLIS